MGSVMDLQEDFAKEYQSGYPKGLAEAYDLLECLSQNELCETILAAEKTTGRKVVAKCYYKGHPYFDETEPRQMQGLSFDGIPAYEGEYSSEFLRCILREYVPGESLWECPRMFFSRDFICKVGIKLCRILEYLHGQNPPVIHRDIKPRNVILMEDGNIALIDFGISRLYGSDKTSDTRISATRNFAPPEQYGFGQTDARSDIYSLGMLLTWMLTGQERAIDKPKDRLQRILHKCTAFSPGKRYGSAKKVRMHLEKYLLQKNVGYGRTMAGAAAGVAFCLLVGWTGWEISHAMEMAGVDLPWSESDRGEGIRDGQQKDGEGAENGQQGSVSQNDQTGQEAGAADAGEAYTFAEPLIEKAVRCKLGRPEGILTGEDLLGVKEILIIGDEVFSNQFDYGQRKDRWDENVVYGDIKSLEDLKAMPNLESICICRQKLRDVSPLASLSKTRKVEFLANRITDISPIQNLSKLESVDFSENEVSDISPISDKKYLWRVGFGENPVKDISSLAECRYLRELILCSSSVSFDGAPLADIDGFSLLDINNTDTDAYRYLSGKSVDMLKVGATDQKDLECIRDMAYVRELYLYWSHITDISGIEGREDITYLNMEGCIIDDLSPVFTLPNLKKVVLSLKMKKEMEKLLSEYPGEVLFTVEYR